MVRSCSAYGCTQRYEKGITFHSFPKDDLRRKQWLIAMKREKWKPGQTSMLCCRHFRSDCYNTSPWSSKKSLKDDAVPSIFNFPEHLQKKSSHRPSPKKRSHTEAELDIISVAEKTSADPIILKQPSTKIVSEPAVKPPRKKRRIFTGDFEGEPEQYSHEELCRFYNLAKKEIAAKSKEVKLLKQTNSRLQKKLKTVKSLVEHLVIKNMVLPETTSSIMVLSTLIARKIHCE